MQKKILGRAPELDSFENLYELGKMLGSLHEASSGFCFEKRAHYNVNEMGRKNVKYLSENWLGAKNSTQYSKTCSRLIGSIHQALSTGFEESFISIHGDCHLSNILMSHDGPVLLDFDDAMMGPAIQDVWMLLAGDESQYTKQLSELIDGYEEFIEFPRCQLKWVPALRALRVINYTAWLAKRWSDPAFPKAFPWFNTESFWLEHINELQQLEKVIDKSTALN